MAHSRAPSTFALLLVLTVLGVAGCATRTISGGPSGVEGMRAPAMQGRDPVDATMAPQALPTRAIIRRARAEIVVANITAAAAGIDSMARALGGEPEATQRSERQFTMTLRVPGDQLDFAVAALDRFGRVESRAVVASDVTDQMADMNARLDNLKAVRDRLRGYLDRTGTIADVIAVERELVRVQSEIDSLEARLTLVRGRVEMAELSVRATQEVRLGPIGALFAGIGQALSWLFVRS